MLLLTYSSTGANGAAGAAAEALLPELGQIMLMLQHLYSVQALFACALPFLLLADESVFMLLEMMNLPLDLVCFNLPRWTCFWLLLAAFQILIAILKLCYFFFAAAGVYLHLFCYIMQYITFVGNQCTIVALQTQ